MAKHLEKELNQIKKMIYCLGAQVEESLDLAIKSFQENNAKLAQQIISNDRKIDEQEVVVEEECLKALALYQPVAIDLRFIVAVMKMTSDLERIGDLAADIAKNGLSINQAARPKVPLDLYQMGYLAKSIVRKALDALIELDPHLAREVIHDDIAINAMKAEMKAEILEALQHTPAQTETLVTLLAVSHRLERIGDHATNIAEDVIYMLEADIVRHQTESQN